MLRDSNLFKSRHTKLKVVTSMGFQNVIEKKSKLENKKQVCYFYAPPFMISLIIWYNDIR